MKTAMAFTFTSKKKEEEAELDGDKKRDATKKNSMLISRKKVISLSLTMHRRRLLTGSHGRADREKVEPEIMMMDTATLSLDGALARNTFSYVHTRNSPSLWIECVSSLIVSHCILL